MVNIAKLNYQYHFSSTIRTWKNTVQQVGDIFLTPFER